jgi:hypothetical protein
MRVAEQGQSLDREVEWFTSTAMHDGQPVARLRVI